MGVAVDSIFPCLGLDADQPHLVDFAIVGGAMVWFATQYCIMANML